MKNRQKQFELEGRKFSNESEELFGYHVFTSDCKEWAVANPKIFNGVTDAVNVYEHLEKAGFNFLFSAGSALYFRKRK